MSYKLIIGPVIIINEKNESHWAKFFISKDNRVYIQKASSDPSSTCISWDMDPILIENTEAAVINWLAYDPETRQMFFVRKTRYFNGLDLYTGTKKFHINSDGRQNRIPENTVVTNLPEIKCLDNFSGLIEKSTQQYQNNWISLGKLRALNWKLVEHFYSAFLKKENVRLNDFPLPLQRILFSFFEEKLETIKSSTKTQQQYCAALKYLMTLDPTLLKSLDRKTLQAVTKFQSCFYGELAELINNQHFVNIYTPNIKALHTLILQSLVYEYNENTNDSLYKKDDVVSFDQQECLFETTHHLLSQLRKKIDMSLTEDMDDLISALSITVEDKTAFAALPSIHQAYLILLLFKAFNQTTQTIPANGQLNKLITQFQLTDNIETITQFIELLDKLNSKVEEEKKRDDRNIPLDWSDESVCVNELNNEFIWWVIINDTLLRQTFINSQTRLSQLAYQYPSITESLIKKQGAYDFCLDTFALVYYSKQKSHYNCAVALYENNKLSSIQQYRSDEDGLKLTDGEYLAISHIKLAIRMINEKSPILTKANRNHVFTKLWLDNKDNALLRKELIVALLNNAKLKPSNKLFSAVSQPYVQTRSLWSIFSWGNTKKVAPSEEAAPLQSRLQ